jgi:4-hydroxy-3-methylbut-2-enyl diphosphate reductase
MGLLPLTVHLANPRGFCAGVDRAIAIVEEALVRYGPPVYVRHEVVHNRHVVDRLNALGARFVETLEEVPDQAVVIFSAHGVAQAVRQEAAARGLKVLDATCPLVTKVHLEVQRLYRDGYAIVMIGHAGHPEVEGTMGQVPDRVWLVETEGDVAALPDLGERVAYVTQTTLSVDDARRIVAALKARFPTIVAPRKEDICYATQNRQEAVRRLAAQCNPILVIGSKNSSNSNRLREVAETCGATAYLIDGPDEIDPAWLATASAVGVTAGASAPETLVASVVNRLRELGATAVCEEEGIRETVHFPLPKELQNNG